LLIPYLKNISFERLTDVLDDSASDTVLNLRRAIRKGIKEQGAKDLRTIAEFKSDVIDPEIEALERAFKKARATYRVSLGAAAIGFIGLSLSAVIGTSQAAVVSGLLGGGGIVAGAKEFSAFLEKIESMKDNPFYLFWRAKRMRSRKH
jgi:hypothetical protein